MKGYACVVDEQRYPAVAGDDVLRETSDGCFIGDIEDVRGKRRLLGCQRGRRLGFRIAGLWGERRINYR